MLVAGQVIDIQKSQLQRHGGFAGRAVLVRHFLSGRIQIYWDGECVAWAEGKRPKVPQRGARTLLGVRKRRRQKAERDKQQQADEEDMG